MKTISMAALSALVVLAACSDSAGPLGPLAGPDHPVFSTGESAGGVEPTAYAGNISGGAEGVCEAVGEAGWLTGDKWEDSQANPLASQTFVSAGFTFGVSLDGKYLDWISSGNIMRAVVVKGGDGYHVYPYNPDPATQDQGLHSPLNSGGQVPEISWFAFCYEPGSNGSEGCTQGFWKNNADKWGASQWPVGYAPSDAVTDHFVVPAAFTTITGATLIEALNFTGGGGTTEARARRLVQQAVAALLSAAHPDVDYPRTTTEIVDDVNDALASMSNTKIDTLKDALDADNNAGCPLSQNGS